MECMYYEKIENNAVKCHLCPHKCTIQEGNIGVCKARKNVQGTLISLNYGKITSYAYDTIEKKPLYHFHPGSNILSIGSFGCNLACDYCQNWEIAHVDSLTMEIEDKDIILLGKSRGSIGIAYTYNEPSISYEYVYHMTKLAKREGLKNVLVTNGYINEEPLKQLLPHIDAMNIDLKSIARDYYIRICKGKLEPVLRTIELAAKATHIEITNLVVEGENSSEDQINELAQWISNIDKTIPLHLSKYFPAYKMKLPETTYDILRRAKEIANKHLDYVYIGNVWGIDNNTYCPNCSNQIISRYDRGEVKGIKDRKCIKCGEKIKIIY